MHERETATRRRRGWMGTLLVAVAGLGAVGLVLAARVGEPAGAAAVQQPTTAVPTSQDPVTTSSAAPGQAPGDTGGSTTAAPTTIPETTTTVPQTTTTAVPPLGDPITGLMYRTQEHVFDDEWTDVIGGGVVTALWSDLEPNQGEYDFSSIRSAAAIYNEVGITALHLRVFGGVSSPRWLKDQLGTKRWVAENTVSIRQNRLPNMWTGEYAAAWSELNQTLAAQVGSDFVQVQVSGAGTVFAEPFIRQLSRKEPIAALTKWGITLDMDRELQREIFSVTEAAWGGIAHRVISVFPWQYLVRGEPQWGQIDETFDLIAEFTEINPELILMANDLRARPGSIRRALHRRLSNQPNRLMFQTASDAVVGDLSRTLDRGWGYGAQAIELPSEFRSAGIETRIVSACAWPRDAVPPC